MIVIYSGRVVKRIREGVGYAEEEEKKGNESAIATTAASRRLPHHPPKRVVVREVAGTNVVITCPTNKRREIVKWFKDGVKMSPLRLRRTTRGRIVIDKRRRIHVRSVRAADEGRYDCYDDGYLKGRSFSPSVGVRLFSLLSLSLQ